MLIVRIASVLVPKIKDERLVLIFERSSLFKKGFSFWSWFLIVLWISFWFWVETLGAIKISLSVYFSLIWFILSWGVIVKDCLALKPWTSTSTLFLERIKIILVVVWSFVGKLLLEFFTSKEAPFKSISS